MITTYDNKSFSLAIKSLRKSMGYTISDVSSATGINQNTIKLLEKGNSMPRFDTLHILSNFYKCDLVMIYKECSYDSVLMSYFHDLNEMTARNDSDSLKNVLLSVSKRLQNSNISTIDSRDLSQLKLYIEGLIVACNISNPNENFLALNKYEQALALTNASFRFDKFDKYKYHSLELNILFSAAVLLGVMRECQLSNQILYFVLDHFNSIASCSNSYKLMVSKLYSVLSYNFHRLDNHTKALDYADIGIAYCNKSDTHMYLPMLLLRKGVSLYHLKRNNWREFIDQSILLLELQGRLSMVSVYKNIQNKLDLEIKAI